MFLIKGILDNEDAVRVIFLFHEFYRILNKLFAKREVVNIISAILKVFLDDYSAFEHVIVIDKSVK